MNIRDFYERAVLYATRFQPGDTAITAVTNGGLLTVANSVRTAPILHRSSVTVPDVVAVPGSITLAGVSDTGGTLLASTAYYVAVAAMTSFGYTPASTPVSITTASSGQNAIRVTIPAVTGATGYAIYLSTATSPLWVGEVTATELAAGGFAITTPGTVASGFANPAGTIDVLAPGSGTVASNVYVGNTAFVVPATYTAVACGGYSIAHVGIDVTLTDSRSQPSLGFVPFFLSGDVSNPQWRAGQRQSVGLLVSNGQALHQTFDVQVSGANQLLILFDALAGQGASVNVSVELS